MKNIIFIAGFVVVLIGSLFGQTEKNNRMYIKVNVIPFASMMTNGNGLMIEAGYKTSKRFVHSLSLGMFYNNSPSGHEVENFTVNGQPIRKWSTEIDYTTDRPYGLDGVVSSLDFKNLDDVGIKHYKPGMTYRINRFVGYELGYSVPIRKFNLNFGVGVQLGITNRDDTHVGFTGKVKVDLTGQEEEFWVNINIRAKYLYLGGTTKIEFDYPISSNLRLGVTGGLHFIFDKNFMEDTKIAYTGLIAKVGIN